jgi:hypothetical protein
LYVLKEKRKVQPSQDNREETWWRILRRDQPSLAQLLNNIQRPTRTRFKKRARLGTKGPNIAQPSWRHKNQSPRSLEAQTSGECATSADRRVTLPIIAQVQQWAVALTVNGQTSACHRSDRSDRCRPGLPPLKQTSQTRYLLQEQGLEASTNKKLQGMVWPTRTKATFAMHAIKRVTWAKIAQMVPFLNRT